MDADPHWRLNPPEFVPRDAGGSGLRMAPRHSAAQACLNAVRTAAVVSRTRNHLAPAYSIGGRTEVRHWKKALVRR